MRIVVILLCAVAADLILGDPEQLAPVHPVVLMGKIISRLEVGLRRWFPATGRGERHAGIVLAAVLPAGVFFFSFFILWILRHYCPPAAWALEILWCWQVLAIKDLRTETMRVYTALKGGSLKNARYMVSRIVGRDTEQLDEAGVTRAAVETVAENFSDGIVAPLFYMIIGGAPLALCYKAINTMDSMVGYKNDKYLYFGRAAARLDDAANWIPSRIAAWMLIAAAAITGQDARGAYRIWKRDRRNHASPNSAQCEAAAAGALGIRLAGPASYFGKIHVKPYIGDSRRPVQAEDIYRICRMELAGSILCTAVFCIVRILAIRLFGG